MKNQAPGAADAGGRVPEARPAAAHVRQPAVAAQLPAAAAGPGTRRLRPATVRPAGARRRRRTSSAERRHYGHSRRFLFQCFSFSN